MAGEGQFTRVDEMSQQWLPLNKPDEDAEQVANDAMQLLNIATFNGLCRVIAALGENGLLDPSQLENIHDAVTTPLDDPDWRDDTFITDTRQAVERVLAKAMKHSQEHGASNNDE